MRYRSIKALLAITTVSAFAVPGVAQARHGSDDGAGHVLHAHHVRHHARHAHLAVTHARHGADDGANHR